jgi:uncharacterized membrane protein
MKIRLFVAFILWEALVLAVVGQFALQKMGAVWVLATAVFLFTLFLVYQSRSLRPPWFTAESLPVLPPLLAIRPPYRLWLAVMTLLFALTAYFGLANNRFTSSGFIAWLLALLCFILVFAEKPAWQIRWQRHHWFLLGILLIGIFYRFYRLPEVPVDFGSDQIEKLLDVYDVLQGERPLFFPRNTGREALQFYWTALLIRFTPLDLNFTALKVGTGIFSVWTLFWVYLLGKELYGRHVGLLAALFMAMSHWHIAITRIGLRFVFTAAFLTPTLYFLIRAFRYNRRNDWLAAGAFLGIGLHTYIPMRMVPLLLLVLTAVKLIFDWWQRCKPAAAEPFAESSALNWRFWGHGLSGGLMALLFFLPLLRYMVDYPQMFWFRAASRLTTNDQAINYWQTFWGNSQRAWLMFNYQGDSVYANNLPHSPMLDEVTAALFVLGLVYLLWQLVRYRDRRSLYVLLSLAIMLLPSILSFAFTSENPSAARTGGAIPLVMITAVLPLYAVWHYVTAAGLGRERKRLATAVMTIFITAALIINYNWYFVRYDQSYRQISLNHSELAYVTQEFIQRGGQLTDVYHVTYPHWTDTRAIAILNGQPYWNQSIHDLAGLIHHANPDRRQLFLLNTDDLAAVALLNEILPQGQLTHYDSAWSPDKKFFIFETPGAIPDPPGS